MASLDFLHKQSPEWLRPLENGVKSLLGFLGYTLAKIFGDFSAVESDMQRIHTNLTALTANLKSEGQKLKDFKFQPKWNQRVINVPKAIEHIKQLADDVMNGWRERIDKLEAPVKSFVAVFKQEAEPDPLGDKPAAVTRVAVKIGHVVTLVHQLADASDEIVKIEALFTTIREDIETLEPLFLQQGNSRATKREKAFVRIGKLHQS
jgi:hypothetical protein